MEVDFIIVGQGISGTMLSRQLMEAGQRVPVIDEAKPVTASKIASGLINPVTGKKYVTTWLADILLPFAKETYTQLGQQFRRSFLRECDVLNFHPTAEAASLFAARENENDTYLNHVNRTGAYSDWFRFNYGIGAVSPSYLVDVSLLLDHWREHLAVNHSLLEAHFTLEDCHIADDHVDYKNISAGKIIFCEGAADIDNPYFTRLNFQLNKGEVIYAQIPSLSQEHIYKHGPISIIPWQEDVFWIGSTFNREYTDDQPTPAFRKLIESTLDSWLKLPYTIVGHQAAIRPATGGQKPFIGIHPVSSSVGIFNGMGSKGCSLAPYFAHQFTQHLLHGALLIPEADIQRFAKILSR